MAGEFTRSMSTGFKLTYFDLYARGETARMLFKLGGRPFEDVRVKMEDWPAMKEEVLLNQLPFLEKDGHVLTQSNAINRFLAKRFSLAGKSVLEEALADMVVDTALDATNGIESVIRASEEEKEEKAAIFTENVNNVLPKVQLLLERNNEGEGFFVGNALTWADVLVYNLIEFCDKFTTEDTWSQFPKLQAFKERFESVPAIAKHLETRPPAPF